MKKPLITNNFRSFWCILSRIYEPWKELLVAVQPETVIKWHRNIDRIIWKRKSKSGRPSISIQTIALIKRIHRENPLLSPEKIHELLINMNILDAPAPNTIAKYIKHYPKSPPKQSQSWKSFLHNHNVWSMDCFTIPTINFKRLHVLVIISHKRRRIEHIAVTSRFNTTWLIQQIRDATPFGKQPKYLLHDNDSVFLSNQFQQALTHINIKSTRTAYKSPWQNGICERAIGIIKRELIDHIIPLNEHHLRKLLREYVSEYYNPHRTHQGINCETPDKTKSMPITFIKNTKINGKPILGGLYTTYDKVA